MASAAGINESIEKESFSFLQRGYQVVKEHNLDVCDVTQEGRTF